MEKRALTVEVRVGETLSIDGGRLILRVEEKSGQRARLRFEMPKDVEVRKVVPGAAHHAARGVSVA